MVSRRFNLIGGLFLLVLLLVSGTTFAIAADMEAYPDDGLKNCKIEWFHTLHFFKNAKDVEEGAKKVVESMSAFEAIPALR